MDTNRSGKYDVTYQIGNGYRGWKNGMFEIDM